MRVACLAVADSERVVVAGAGLAGLRTVTELRSRGFTGPITLVGAEVRPPYDRPPLSKKVLTDPALDPSLRADFGAYVGGLPALAMLWMPLALPL